VKKYSIRQKHTHRSDAGDMAQYYQPQPSYDNARRAVDELVQHMQVPVNSYVSYHLQPYQCR